MKARTDQELVTESEPGARVLSRRSPVTWVTQYRVSYALAGGRPPVRHPWCPTRKRAWRAACARLGLRDNRPV